MIGTRVRCKADGCGAVVMHVGVARLAEGSINGVVDTFLFLLAFDNGEMGELTTSEIDLKAEDAETRETRDPEHRLERVENAIIAMQTRFAIADDPEARAMLTALAEIRRSIGRAAGKVLR